MKRTSIFLSDEADARVRQAARRRGVSTAQVIREAVNSYLPESRTEGDLSFFGIGASEREDVSDRADEYVAQAINAADHLDRR